jgi:4,5-DOPA dioxygenase extradiol
MATSSTNSSNAEPYWLKNLKELPETPEKIPAFFFSHGSPILAFSKKDAAKMGPFAAYQGPSGPLARFLEAFGPILLKKYNPKAIVVFSAHWETHGTRLGEYPLHQGHVGIVDINVQTRRDGTVTDYKPENPLLMDYYGFQPDVYQLKFKSVGDSTLAQRVVDLYKQVSGLRSP